MRILLVEDHSDSAAVVVRVLSAKGHAVEAVASADQAMRRCREGTYDLLIADIGLPDLDGWALLEAVRGRCVVRAIALTGYGGAAEVERSRLAGFDAHLTKPIEIGVLLETVRRFAA
jgi:two-component system CheB/CheR fusion protein